MSIQDPRPLLISVAPNGPRRGKQDHEDLPLTAAEIGRVAAACREAGAGMIHLHVRDGAGAHSLSPQLYRVAQREVRHLAGSSLVVQVTAESEGVYDLAQQMASLRSLDMAAASFRLAEFFPSELVQAAVAEFFAWLVARGVACQFELDSPAQVAQLKQLVLRGHLALPQPHALFVLGRPGQRGDADPAELDAFLAHWPKAWPWSVCAYGRTELLLARRAIERGGHVRVGFEYALVDGDGQLLASNEQRVAQVAAIAAECGRPLLAPEDVRPLFWKTA